MISLLLTLFISLFSIGSPINTIDELKENEIILNESKPINNSIYYNNYYYFGFDELVSYNNYNIFLNYIKQYDYFPMSDTSVENFILGSSVRINLRGYDVAVGNISDFEFVVYPQGTNTLEYIEFSLDKSLDSYWVYKVSFRYDSSVYTAKGSYNFLSSENNVITNIIFTRDGTPIDFYNACLKFNGSQFGSLFGCYNVPKDSYDVGRDDGYRAGYQSGYNEGLSHAEYDSTALSIFTGITSIALVPINMFLQIFNFEILGINLSGFISGILTVAVVVIIIRMITGGKKDD